VRKVDFSRDSFRDELLRFQSRQKRVSAEIKQIREIGVSKE